MPIWVLAAAATAMTLENRVISPKSPISNGREATVPTLL